MPVYHPDRKGRTEVKIGKVVVDVSIAVHKEFG